MDLWVTLFQVPVIMLEFPISFQTNVHNQGPVVRSLVSAYRWLRGIKTKRFPWYLMLVSANHASSNPGQKLE